MSLLVSVNVGLPVDIEWQGKVVHTAVWKRPVAGRVMARRLNLDGDGQGDLAGHGGEHRAVMVYQLDSYRYWETHLARHDFEYGQFGENLTVDGLGDDEVCIGDRYQIGGALFEVTQPRVTCYRVGIRMNNPQMPALLVSHKRPGFYCRVIEEGEIGAGDEIVKVAEGPEHVTVQEIDGLLYLPGRTREQLQRALRVPSLSAGWKGSLAALADAEEKPGQGGNAGLAPSFTTPPMWRGFRTLRVAAVHPESVDVLSFVLESEDRNPLPTPLPGQFLIFKLKLDKDSDPILRSYSMSGPSGTGTYRISVKRAAGAGSRYFHDSIRAGDLLQVSAPRGSFTLAPGDLPVVLLSAGIGATPVLSMLHSLADSAANSMREVWWCYGTRNGKEHPFVAEVRTLLSGLPHGHSFVAYSKPEDGDQSGKDYDVSGRLNLSSLQQLQVPKEADFYLCGPAAFLRDFVADLKSWGIHDSYIHSEVFGSESAITPGIAPTTSVPPHPPAESVGAGPGVSFTRSGLTVPWDSRYGSLLELAEACDVPVRWACRVGVCHTCESGLIDGRISYAPEPLDRPVEANVLICCSTPQTAVELDL
ncbi:Flavohemoprotein (Hemoglobin-like protein) (Flavohemoglobin) (Nitric oxide dioxygenase) [Acidisarcina polymorpha]|uniref:Flavohemoprotein (Hemoglobin-like protein) (Flavohemoglobin) (Nitric oxide dioxygenase) n=1 Tax=Acidisarcina polymorpha TaxID=2211140 RepID=A0A2Z5G1G4_9BACT|nr:MOSC and FAD-binding oxidoreductase domain-containing protein [Acidisarcina polymorpha]AXC13023.1 Flavohemoprotein (Hemoglobin-like protein) (Flavohemoglobin) (Nitric oxide dioxygenase) [Acidisarcina polymorpha]